MSDRSAKTVSKPPFAAAGGNNRKAGAVLKGTLQGVLWRFRWCPAGSFTMGDINCPTAAPHKVTLTKGFWLGETQMAQEQWQSMVRTNPSHFKMDKLPVEQVSWNESQEFITKLNGLNALPAGFQFSLPTEAQWEYACRAGSTTDYCFGDDARQLGNYAWYGMNSGKTTHPVGQKKANAWGFYDMHGNVWEWCSDLYGDYPRKNVTDPAGALSGVHRVIRGGSWGFGAGYCRSAYRDISSPGNRRRPIGLRLAIVDVR